MSFLIFVNHAVNFLAPALWLALLLPLAAKLLFKKVATIIAWRWQALLLFVLGAGVLLAGLVTFGSDGKMLTYLALLLILTSTQWLLLRRRL